MFAVTYDFNHLQKAIDAVDQRINDVKTNTTDKNTKIKASSGLIISSINPSSGAREILMGRLNKLDRPNPKDDAGVHGSYGLFSGSVELSDADIGVPAVCAAAAREVREESLGVLSDEKVLFLLSQPSTQLIENAGWKFFTAASFHVQISREEGDKIIAQFQEKVSDHKQPEITQLSWISFKELIQAQIEKDERYDKRKSELEQAQERAFTPDELRTNKELGKIYNENLALSSGKVAHYVARTLVLAKDKLE